MPASARCPSCGGPLRPGQPGGACLPCLLQLGLHDTPDTDGNDGPTGTSSPGASGARFGPYELLEEIARGGMGVVYRARQISLDRVVAVKMVLNARFAGDERAMRFRTEAESAARLRHPNIVRIHDIGEHDGQPYFSMDFVGGGDLADLVRKGLPPFARTAALLRTLARAVDFAHRQGVLHRDLKPSNILLDEHGEPIITDFGLARRLDGTNPLTITGEVLGSPGYLPPEQAGGSPSRLGPAVDVYGLGGVLYFLLTGRAPFVAETVGATLRLVLNGDPVSPRVLNPLAPVDLATIALKCLQRDPTQRYASAADVADELDRFLAGRPILARPLGPWGRLSRQAERHPIPFALGVATLLLLLVVSIGSPVAALRLRHGRQVLATNAYAADMKLAQMALEEGDAGKARRYLALHETSGSPDPRGFEWGLYRNLAQDRAITSIQAHSNVVDGLVFLPGGQTLVTCEMGERIRFWKFPSLDLESELPTPGRHLAGLAISPDGRWLAAGSIDKELRVWELPARRLVYSAPGHFGGLAFSPVEPVLARAEGSFVTGSDPGPVTLRNLESGRDVASWTNAGARVAWTPRGDRLISGTVDGRIQVRDPKSGTLLASFDEGDFLLALVVSPDGQTLASSAFLGRVRLRDLTREGAPTVLEGHRAKVWSLCFSPDSRRVATASSDRTVRIWERATGRLLRTLSGHDSEVWTVAFSPDGRRLVSGDKAGVLRVWEPDDEIAKPPAPEPAVVRGMPVWSTDGKRLAFGSDRHAVTVLDVETGAPALSVPDAEVALAFAPDGQWLDVLGRKGYARRRLPGLAMIDARPVVPPPTNYLYSATSRDGRRFACEDAPGIVSVWDVPKGALLSRISIGPGGQVTQLAFSPDGESLALARSDFVPGEIRSVHTSRSVLLSGHRMAIWQMAWSSDGRRLATASMDDTAKIWDPETGRELASLPNHREGASGVAFSPDDRTLAVLMGARSVRLWNCASWREMGDLELRKTSLFLGFSDDGGALLAWYPWDPSAHVEFLRSRATGPEKIR